MTLKKILLLLIVGFMLNACSENKLDIDVSSIDLDTKFTNLDSTFVHSKSNELIRLHHQFEKEITDIYDYQLGYCLNIGKISDTAFLRSIHDFTNDKFIKRVEKRIEEKFSNLESKKINIIEALKHLKFHFPQGKIPKNVVFLNSLFQSNAACTENEIGIGLERYLGANADVIKELPEQSFFTWIKEGMDEQFLERDAVCSWIMTHYVPEKSKDLADGIIQWGKIIYLTEACFPNEPKNKIIRYSIQDYKWAEENELSYWKYLVNEKLLFKNDERDKANMLKEGPFTIGLPEKGPDRLGQYLGWRIVQKFMDKNDISLEQLIKTPYNEILQAYEIED